jgi:hypothetical protein
MQPQDLIRKAAEIIKVQGWSQGADARDHNGDQVPLMSGTSGDMSRSRINPAAVRLSIYGALVKAMDGAGTAVANPGLMWDTMYGVAKAKNRHAEGGTNYVHPILQFNEDEGRTVEEVLSFLETCALEIEVARMEAV